MDPPPSNDDLVPLSTSDLLLPSNPNMDEVIKVLNEFDEGAFATNGDDGVVPHGDNGDNGGHHGVNGSDISSLLGLHDPHQEHHGEQQMHRKTDDLVHDVGLSSNVEAMSTVVVDKAELADTKLVDLSGKQDAIERRFKNINKRVNLLRNRAIGTKTAGELAKVRKLAQRLHQAELQQKRAAEARVPGVDDPVRPETTQQSNAETSSRATTSSSTSAAAAQPAVAAPSVPPVRSSSKKPPPRMTSAERARAGEALGGMESNLRHLIQNYDSEATESSSGGESCDELDNFPPSADHYMPVKKRAKYTWLSNRASIASRWTWLTAQISDLEYRIRQTTDVYRQIRASKGPVTLGEPVVSWPPHAKKAVMASQAPQEVPLSCKPVTRDYSRVDSQGRKIIIKEPSSPAAETAGLTAAEQHDDGSLGACRTRPVKMLKRRRILTMQHVARTTPRANKESSVRCDCPLPSFQCAICYGRHNHTQAPDPVTMERRQVLGLLDHSYHQVLSGAVAGREEVPLDVQMMQKIKNRSWLSNNSGASLNQLIREGEREKKKYIKRLKKESTSVADAAGAATPSASTSADDRNPSSSAGSKHLAHMQRYKKKVKKRVELPPHSRNSGTKRVRSSAGGGPDHKNPHRRKSLTIHHQNDDRVSAVADLGVDENGSPVPSPNVNASNQAWADHIRRKRETAFDIDNIVIPYSIAAATRVERLKYKEIITPTWRAVGDDDKVAKSSTPAETKSEPSTPAEPEKGEKEKFNSSGDNNKKVVGLPEKRKKKSVSICEAGETPAKKRKKTPSIALEDEDITETNYEVRHAKAELEEQRRWQTPLWKTSGGQRSRSSRRQDSRVDRQSEGGLGSSGYNTPDPLSPGMVERVDTLEVNTRPSTPTMDDAGASSTPGTPTSAMAASIRNRRRTSSATKSRDRNPSEDTQSSRCTTPVNNQQPELELVDPWDPRPFPLPDDVYQVMLEDMPTGHTDLHTPGNNSVRVNNDSNKKPAAVEDDFEELEEEEEEEDPDWNGEELEEEEDPDDPEWATGGDGGAEGSSASGSATGTPQPAKKVKK